MVRVPIGTRRRALLATASTTLEMLAAGLLSPRMATRLTGSQAVSGTSSGTGRCTCERTKAPSSPPTFGSPVSRVDTRLVVFAGAVLRGWNNVRLLSLRSSLNGLTDATSFSDALQSRVGALAGAHPRPDAGHPLLRLPPFLPIGPQLVLSWVPLRLGPLERCIR